MIRTLIVDDDFAVAGMHRRFVEALDGFEVAGVLERGQPVLEFLEQHEVDLVLLDVHLPDYSGVDVLQELRRRGQDTAVIMVTAASERDTVRRAIGHGVDGYLVKPFSREEFDARLREFAEQFAAAESTDTVGADDAADALDQAEIDLLVRGVTGRGALGEAGASGEGAAVGNAVAGAGAGEAGLAELAARLPKGFSAPTLQRVAQALQEPGPGVDLSAREVAEACGVSRVSARRYLDFLSTRGLAQLRPKYGATGRPEHRYLWTG
ncbi:response regulator transcription factor [Micrococcus terreus]|uniref:response regulator transcription factor n=1 Tax=Micrococcus terreus TaxID=574650 RepID=UPI003D7465E4